MAKTQDETVTDTTGAAPAVARMSVQLTPEGRIAWDRIRPATREQLARVLADPAVSQQLGGVAVPVTASAPAAGTIQPEFCGVIYDALSQVTVALAQRNGYTPAQAELARVTADEKAALAAPTAAVLNKYIGPVGKYQEEAALLMLLASVTAGKVTALRAAAAAAGDERYKAYGAGGADTLPAS